MANADLGYGTHRFTTVLPTSLHAAIKQAAIREGLSTNAWMLKTLESALGLAPLKSFQRDPKAALKAGLANESGFELDDSLDDASNPLK